MTSQREYERAPLCSVDGSRHPQCGGEPCTHRDVELEEIMVRGKSMVRWRRVFDDGTSYYQWEGASAGRIGAMAQARQRIPA